MKPFNSVSHSSIIHLTTLLIVFTLSLNSILCKPTSRVYFNSHNGDQVRSSGIPRNFNLHKRQSSILQVDLEEYKSRTGGGEVARDIFFPTDEERDREFRSRLTTSSSPLDILDETSSESEPNLLPDPDPPSNLQNSNPTELRENPDELVKSFLNWAEGQNAPFNIIPTFNTTRKFGDSGQGVSWSLTVGTGLKCPGDHVQGVDGVCRPRVLF